MDVANRGAGSLTAGGGALVVIGVVVVANAELATRLSVALVGAGLLAGGLVALAVAAIARIIDRLEGWTTVATGAIAVAAGVVILAKPVPSTALLTVVAACLFIATGALWIVVAVGSEVPARGWLVVSGAVGLAFGVIVLTRWPDASPRALGVYTGIQVALDGVVLIAMGRAHRRSPG